MDWVTRVSLLAEMDRELHSRHRKLRQRWSSKLTAKQLGIPTSTLSMALSLHRGLDRWPELKQEATIRKAYNVYRQKAAQQ